MKKEMFDTLFIDCDDTIYNYQDSDRLALDRLFRRINTDFPQYTIVFLKECYEHVVKECKQSNNINNKHNKFLYFKKMLYCLSIPLSYLEGYVHIYEDTFVNVMKPTPGVKEFLLDIRNYGGIRDIVLLSNNRAEKQMKRLMELNILSLFDDILTTDEIGEEKPHPLVFEHALQRVRCRPDRCIMIGDGFESDIRPSLYRDMLCFHYDTKTQQNEICLDTRTQKYYYRFNDFFELNTILKSIFMSAHDLLHLSRYFGQSDSCVQGSGGNISFKNKPDTMWIKKSGTCMSDMTFDDMCLVATKKDVPKIIGTGCPSIESVVHVVLGKRIVVHLHMTCVNKILCSDTDVESFLQDFEIPYCIVEYTTPGSELAEKIIMNEKEKDIYFLKNHGILLCGDTLEEIYHLSDYILAFFKDTRTSMVFRLYHSLSLKNRYIYFVPPHIFCNMDIDDVLGKNMIYCFPDLAVFFQKIVYLEDAHDDDDIKNSDILIVEKKDVYIITTNRYSFYMMTEILYSYCVLYSHYQETDRRLLGIKNHKGLQKRDDEMYRRNIKR